MYATVTEANNYVRDYYSSADPLRIKWEALTEADKQVMLNRSEQVIDLLPMQGKAHNPGKAFPRDPNKERSLVQAKIATIELAVQTLNDEMQERFQLQRQGVKAYKIGDLSETFGSSSGADYSGFNQLAYSIVLPYLQDWLGGGYRICPTRTRR